MQLRGLATRPVARSSIYHDGDVPTLGAFGTRPLVTNDGLSGGDYLRRIIRLKTIQADRFKRRRRQGCSAMLWWPPYATLILAQRQSGLAHRQALVVNHCPQSPPASLSSLAPRWIADLPNRTVI